MKKLVKVVMLSTEKASLFLHMDGNVYLNQVGDRVKTEFVTPQHLYLTSDEKIEEGDYYIGQDNKTHKAEKGIHLLANIKKLPKIIATTDKSLLLPIPESLDMYPMSYTPKSVPQIPESFIKAYVEAKGEIKEVLVEYSNEIIGKAHDEHGLYSIYKDIPKLRPDNTVIISVSKTYTREDMLLAFEIGRNFQLTGENNLNEIL